ncbi:sperm flagellar protein 2-like [Genypterus blacodes]|uniref:sperm flagellar protein 2-like n=1 Tax=Genypterus blacodes TaxID=154954 RepID=UPI003F76E715
MSDILCRWLNKELRISKSVEPKTFAKDFSSGYLLGEVLHKYQLQDDFNMFTKSNTSVSKRNNFTRVEPTLQLLGIPIDMTIVQGLMQEQQGVAKRLLYQIYVSMENKKKAGIGGTVMEIMQPTITASLHLKDQEIYSDRLHNVVKHDAEMKLPKISQHYEEKAQPWNDRSVTAQLIQQQRKLKAQEEVKLKSIERGTNHQKQNEIMTHNKVVIAQVPKPPGYRSQQKKQEEQRHREHQAQKVQAEIAQFERSRKKFLTSDLTSLSREFPRGGNNWGCDLSESSTKIVLQSNSKYIQEIRQRLEDDATSRQQREKRRCKFLMEQLKAHEAQQEAQREDQLVKRLTRQTRQEQCLAVQLLQMRTQKEVMLKNRLFREQQYQEQREKEFHEALEREAALARQARLDHAEEIKKELESCNRLAAERAQNKYKKRFKSCLEIMEQTVDLATKVGEYRLLTGNLIPEKLMIEWKELLISGLPLYETVTVEGQQPGFESSSPLDPVEFEKQEKLNNQDYDEYTNMAGEWAWPEEAGEAKLPLINNRILGHVALRLRNIVHPPILEPLPTTPQFNLKACVLGKLCSGKSTCLAKIAKAYGVYVLSADRLAEEAQNAYQNVEVVEKPEEKDGEKQLKSPTPLQSGVLAEEESKDSKRSTKAMQGAAVAKALRRGKVIPNELLVDIVVEAIRQVPAQSGWVLDGFPKDITQARLLEKALGGSADVKSKVVSSRTKLASEPAEEKTPPPPGPVLDVALLLDISDECVVRRAVNQTSLLPKDKSLKMAKIQHRITAFQDTWPKLEKWFDGKQKILVRVHADMEEEELYKRVETVLQQVMMKTQKDEVLDNQNVADSSSSAMFPSADQDRVGEEPVSSLSSEISQEHSKSSAEAAPPLPGSPSWVYVDEPLPPEIPKYLCPHWDTVCESYVSNIKIVMQKLRPERTLIIHKLYNLREEYKLYLGRPDLKQEVVSRWQTDFNSIPDDMRHSEDTKAELHQRLDDLCECLWDICEKRKEEEEEEKSVIIGDEWLNDHTDILMNHYSTLMQVELDRFQDTLCILRSYYVAMHMPVLPEQPSDFLCVSLMDITESNDPKATSDCDKVGDEEEKPKTKLRPPSSEGVFKPSGQRQEEPANINANQPPYDKLITDYEAALTAIDTWVSAVTHKKRVETKEQNENPQEREKTSRSSASPPSAPPASSPEPVNENSPENNQKKEVREKIQKEYEAALDYEERAVKGRIELVKVHGVATLRSLQSRTEQTFSNMDKWLEAQYVAEMKSIERLTEVVRHHIESGLRMQNELVLESTDIHLNGGVQVVPSLPATPRPPPLEKSTQSMLTIVQLEFLYHQLFSVAPSGQMSSIEFSSLLWDIISVSMGRDDLPEPWINMDKTQLSEIVSLLTEDSKLIDWRRFLLSAALPWPFPSLTQLLDVLHRFQAADTGNTGFIHEEQYLQTELWFLSEEVKPVPEDRLANLHKLLFQMFADRSSSPPRLDYVSMLQYFAADPDPTQGFIRALSVVLGKHLQRPSSSRLVKSMPSIAEATEFASSDSNGEQKEEEIHCIMGSLLSEQNVPIPALLAVIFHKSTKTTEDSHLSPCMSKEEHTEHLVHIFTELGYGPEDSVPFSCLSHHPLIQNLMESSVHYKLINIHQLLQAHQEEGELQSMTVKND